MKLEGIPQSISLVSIVHHILDIPALEKQLLQPAKDGPNEE